MRKSNYNSSLVNSLHLRHKLSLNSNHSWYIHDGAKLVPVCNWAILTNALNISCSGVGLHWTDIYEQLREAVRRPGVSSIDVYQLAYPNHGILRYTLSAPNHDFWSIQLKCVLSIMYQRNQGGHFKIITVNWGNLKRTCTLA